MSNLPTKIDLKAVLGDDYHDSNANAESITNKDTTLKQLAKDMSRDRVVIQGVRYFYIEVLVYLNELNACRRAISRC